MENLNSTLFFLKKKGKITLEGKGDNPEISIAKARLLVKGLNKKKKQIILLTKNISHKFQ